MQITEVRVSLRNDDKLKAFVSITLEDSFVIRGLKIISGNSGLFVAMPSRKRPDGQHQDLAHPINDATRKYLTEIVLAEYQVELKNPGRHVMAGHGAPQSNQPDGTHDGSHDGHHEGYE
ncbi:MAG: septation protein SpoVG [Candidatus Eisenbacteria bacterium]|uniref:Septation protein SpoVG n=1 Tax=Eiseniibacteriota bacterium TaxID=2212470 RepID=A0A849SLC4_UNCEI|nr:septation protein SpoVG [Candidatus Eisenbacteria bacterium]